MEWQFIVAQAPSLTLQGKIAIFTTVAIFLAMQRKRVVPIDLLFLAGLVVLTLTGVLAPDRALAGFSNKAVLLIAALLAASLSFVTPRGYQTNLMVMGPGGYHPRDYWRAGWPLTLLLTLTALSIVPRIFPVVR